MTALTSLDMRTDNDLSLLHESEALKLTFRQGETDRLIIAVTGIGHHMGGVQREEFFETLPDGQNHSCLFVIDQLRSWFSHPDIVGKTVEVAEALMKDLGLRFAHTIGASMGGFGAIKLARHMRIDSALAIAPQYSMNRLVVRERRWKEFRKNIVGWDDWGLNRDLVEETEYFIIYGDHRDDLRHAKRFRKDANVTMGRVQNGGHNVGKHLKGLGLLEPVVAATLRKDKGQFHTLLAKAGGERDA